MLKSVIMTLGKLTLAALLFGWLIHSGQLDFSQLKLFIEDPWLLAAAVFYFGFGILYLGTWRWKILLKGAGYTLSRTRALKLQMTGMFFNSVMPGAVGGDLIKIAYIIRDNPAKGKAQVMMTALLDRIVGLAGLFMVCWIVIVSNLNTVRELPGFWPILLLISGFSVAFILFFAAALYNYRGNDPFLDLFKLRIPGMGFVEKLYSSLRVYRHAKRTIGLSLLLSLAIQGLSLLLFYFICYKVMGAAPVFGKVAVVFPIGITTTAIPLMPGGLGVGHVAFDTLFKMVGLEHGANVFNLFVISQLILNCLGFIPYLSLKKIPIEAEARDGMEDQMPVST